MSSLKSFAISVAGQDVFTSSSTQTTDLGAIASTGDGRYFRYCLAGGSTLVSGTVQQGPAQDATNLSPAGGIAVSAAAVGATQITLTGSLTLAANLLAGSFMSVVVAPGMGITYKVKTNTVVAGAVNCVVTLEDPLLVAFTTATRVTFVLNQYSGVIQAPGTLTAAPIGVALYPITNAQYGWIQSHGQASCLLTGTFGSAGLAVGVLVGGTAGSLAPTLAGTNVLGYTSTIGATGQYGNVYLTID